MARNTIKNMKFCTNFNRTFEGLRLPKGAIYGEDADGFFACYDYRVKGKSGYYRGMPRLALWRKVGAKWACNIEASPTTFGIMRKIYEHEQPPAIDWGAGKFTPSIKNVRKLRVVKAFGFSYYEFALPKGAIYGEDEKGIFLCQNYRVQGKGYVKGLPCLEVWRPVVGGVERKNTTKWVKSREASSTTWAILDLVERENIKISYKDQLRKIAKKQDLRPNYGSVHYTQLFTPAEKVKGASFCCAEIHTSLDEIAKEQKGHPVYVGYWV